MRDPLVQDATATPNPIKLDLDELALIATVGGRRASSFLGLALNAMHREDVAEYRLGELAVTDDSFRWPVEMCPQEMTPDLLAELKGTFTAWIIGSALRELLEHFCLMLDRAHEMACWVAHAKGRLSTAAAGSKHKTFKRATSVGNKIRLFGEDFGVHSPLCESLESLYKARNALSHGFGRVRAHDADDSEVLRVKWKGMDSWAEGTISGTKSSIKNLLNKVTEEELSIRMQPVDRVKDFPVGSALVLEPIDLSEICFFVAVLCTQEFLKALIELLTSLGVETHAPQAVNPAEYLNRTVSSP